MISKNSRIELNRYLFKLETSNDLGEQIFFAQEMQGILSKELNKLIDKLVYKELQEKQEKELNKGYYKVFTKIGEEK